MLQTVPVEFSEGWWFGCFVVFLKSLFFFNDTSEENSEELMLGYRSKR